jgi:hypothetical protein
LLRRVAERTGKRARPQVALQFERQATTAEEDASVIRQLLVKDNSSAPLDISAGI